MTTVVFLLHPRVHLLDLAGPAQVFGSVADATGASWPMVYVADSSPVLSHQGIALDARTTWPELSPDDLVVIPGWRMDPRDHQPSFHRKTLDILRAHYTAGGSLMSVCAGAFALAEAEILDDRRATTHHDLQDALSRRFPQVRVVPDVLFVNDDRVHTSAGIASGIDLALHLVAAQLGPMAASSIARTMVVYLRRNGSQPQEGIFLRSRNHVDDRVHRVQDIIDQDFARALPLAQLAEAVSVSERSLTRAFVRATDTTPLRYQQAIRVEHAEHLIASGTTVEAAARAVGFTDARMLRRLRSHRRIEDSDSRSRVPEVVPASGDLNSIQAHTRTALGLDRTHHADGPKRGRKRG